MPSTTDAQAPVLFDAGLLIATLLKDGRRHAEARPLPLLLANSPQGPRQHVDGDLSGYRTGC